MIGDVVGRGVLAASVMAEIRTALRAYLTEGHAPAQAMSLSNDLLISMGRRRSATAAMLELDLERGELEAVSAGHLPVLLDHARRPRGLPRTAPGPAAGDQRGSGVPRADATPSPWGARSCSTPTAWSSAGASRSTAGLARLRGAAERPAGSADGSLADRVYRALLDEALLEDDVALLATESLPLGAAIEMSARGEPGRARGAAPYARRAGSRARASATRTRSRSRSRPPRRRGTRSSTPTGRAKRRSPSPARATMWACRSS